MSHQDRLICLIPFVSQHVLLCLAPRQQSGAKRENKGIVVNQTNCLKFAHKFVNYNQQIKLKQKVNLRNVEESQAIINHFNEEINNHEMYNLPFHMVYLTSLRLQVHQHIRRKYKS